MILPYVALAAALVILSLPFALLFRRPMTPFFWSQHDDTSINYFGHAEKWDRLEIDGDPAKQDCAATFWRDGKRLAVVTVGRDLESLEAEVAFEEERRHKLSRRAYQS